MPITLHEASAGTFLRFLAPLDGLLDKGAFDARSSSLLEEEQELQQSLKECDVRREEELENLREALELASSAQQSYRLADPPQKRELAIRLCSNRTVAGKEPLVEPHFALRKLVERRAVP